MEKNLKKSKDLYVDGFVLPVPARNLKIYKKMALEAGKVWMKCGALEYKECVGEDIRPDMGGEKIMSFIDLAKPKKGETVVFSYIVYKSRKHRDEVNAKVMKQMEKDKDKWKGMKMPFDMKRMTYGGFKTMVSL